MLEYDNRRRGSIRYSWYALLILTLTYTCHFVDRTVVSIIIEPLKAEFHLSDRQVGLASGLAYALSFAIAGIPIGMMTDRMVRTRLLGTLVAIWSASTLLGGFARSYAMLLVARMCVGAAEAGGSPISMSLIGDLFAPSRRATAVSIYYLSVAIGTGASFIIGGYVTATHGWRAAFWVAGAPGLLLALLILATVREPARGAHEAAPAAPRRPARIGEAWAFCRRQPALMHVTAGMIVSNFVLSSFLVWIASFLIRSHSFDVKEAGLLVGVGAGLFGALGSALGGMLADTLAKGSFRLISRTAAALSICATPAAFLMVHAATPTAAAGCMMVLAFFLNAHFGPAYGLIIGLTPSSMRGLAMSGVQVATNLISFGLGPLVVGAISDAVGGRGGLATALMVTFSLSAWAGLHYLLAGRTADADALRVRGGGNAS